MSNELKIEKLSEKNFDQFVQLIKKLAKYEKLEPPNEQAKMRLKKDGLSLNPKFEAYLGIIGNKYVSYAIFYMTYSTFLAMPTLFLEDFFVIKDHRRKGLGQKMFNFCLEQAKKRNCGRFDLCVIEWNKPGIEFFKKNNAKRLDWIYHRISLVD